MVTVEIRLFSKMAHVAFTSKKEGNDLLVVLASPTISVKFENKYVHLSTLGLLSIFGDDHITLESKIIQVFFQTSSSHRHIRYSSSGHSQPAAC